MARERYKNCKTCGKEFGYSESSHERTVDFGFSRPQYCEECQKKHKKMKSGMSVGYFNILERRKTPLDANTLSSVYHPFQPHVLVEKDDDFDPDRYGIQPEDVEDIYNWLKDPKHQVAVVKGATGSGKSTALVRYLIIPPEGKDIPSDFFTHNGQVFIAQPKRMAATGIGEHTARDLFGSSYGAGFDGGYHIGGERKSDWRNIWVSETHGILLNMLLQNQLEKVGVIFIDEAHERTLQLDQVFLLLKKRLHLYPHIKLFIVSATIDEEKFVRFFGEHTAKSFVIEGKSFGYGKPNYQPEEESLPYDKLRDLVDSGELYKATVQRVMSILEETYMGDDYRDILVFAHGKDAIAQIIGGLEQELSRKRSIRSNVDIYPLHTELSKKEQELATEVGRKDRVRVVVSTNVAEASVTVNGVVYVVDTGIENQPYWDFETSRQVIPPVTISQANALQRWGRSGRTRKGIVYTMYTEKQFQAFLDYPVPDIQRSQLEQVVLSLKSTGISDISTGWVDNPPTKALHKAVVALQEQGALDQKGAITDQGMVFKNFSFSSRVSDLIMLADEFGVGVEVATLLPVIQNGGYKRFLSWDNGWDIYTKYHVWNTQRSFMQGCIDDIEYVLKIFSIWEAGTDIELYLDEQSMEKILQERNSILKSLTGRKKDPTYREVNWDKLDRVRIILSLLFWEIREQESDSMNGNYVYDRYPEEKVDSNLSTSCFVSSKWMNAFRKTHQYQDRITPMILGKLIMWWEDLVADTKRVKNAERRVMTAADVRSDAILKSEQLFESFVSRYQIGEVIKVQVKDRFDPSFDYRTSALVVIDPQTDHEILLEQTDLAFALSKEVVKVFSSGLTLDVVIREINLGEKTVRVTFLPSIESYQQKMLAQTQQAKISRNNTPWISKAKVIDVWDADRPRVFFWLMVDKKTSNLPIIVEASGNALVLPIGEYNIGSEHNIAFNFSRWDSRANMSYDPQLGYLGYGLSWDEDKNELSKTGQMSVSEYMTLLSLAKDLEAREAITSLFLFSNRLEASVAFTDAWIEEVLERFPVGSKTTGKIIRIVNGGYIVLLDERLNLDAYMHQSQTTGSYDIGDNVYVAIQRLTVETGNISLTQKQM